MEQSTINEQGPVLTLVGQGCERKTALRVYTRALANPHPLQQWLQSVLVSVELDGVIYGDDKHLNHIAIMVVNAANRLLTVAPPPPYEPLTVTDIDEIPRMLAVVKWCSDELHSSAAYRQYVDIIIGAVEMCKTIIDDILGYQPRVAPKYQLKYIMSNLEELNIKSPEFLKINGFGTQCSDVLRTLMPAEKLTIKEGPRMTICDVFMYGLTRTITRFYILEIN